MMARSFEEWQKALEGLPSPALVLDMDRFEKNIAAIGELALKYGKRVRLATKSLRSVELTKRALALGSPAFKGLMCMSVLEAAFLHEQGLDDFLVAYPTVEASHLKVAWELLGRGARLALSVDHPEHLEAMARTWKALGASRPLPICLDLDASLRLFSGLIHLGVRRSSILDARDFESRLNILAQSPEFELVGLLSYEAQIAGLPDRNPFSPLLNWAREAVRKISAQDLMQRRRQIQTILKERNLNLRFFNAGGTGSLNSTVQELWIDELAVGSGLYHSHLFDYYSDRLGEAALYFTVPVTRIPAPGVVTCHFGGVIGSGESSRDKAPVVHSPKGLYPLGAEGFGEVQTPFKGPAAERLKLGQRVILRPAKAGESAERFTHIHLLRRENVEGAALTYRGQGQCFY